MASDKEILELYERLNQHLKTTGSMQSLLHAVVQYLREQPDFNARRLLELYQREQSRVVDPTRPPKDQVLEQVLLDALLDQQSKKPS